MNNDDGYYSLQAWYSKETGWQADAYGQLMPHLDRWLQFKGHELWASEMRSAILCAAQQIRYN